ncbi:unnamed protein product [Cochlearia groenlandica]
MKQFISLFLCIVIVFSVSNVDSSLISNLCKNSDDPKLCVSSIQTRSESGDFADTNNQIEIIAISVASAKASATSAYIKEKLSRKDLDPATEETLVDCKKNYQDAVEQLDDSISAMLVNAHSDVDVWLSAAMSAVESCGSEMEERASWNVDDELLHLNSHFFKLCQNALMINKMLT